VDIIPSWHKSSFSFLLSQHPRSDTPFATPPSDRKRTMPLRERAHDKTQNVL
jgi:hypothetical protein